MIRFHCKKMPACHGEKELETSNTGNRSSLRKQRRQGSDLGGCLGDGEKEDSLESQLGHRIHISFDLMYEGVCGEGGDTANVSISGFGHYLDGMEVSFPVQETEEER